MLLVAWALLLGPVQAWYSSYYSRYRYSYSSYYNYYDPNSDEPVDCVALNAAGGALVGLGILTAIVAVGFAKKCDDCQKKLTVFVGE